MYLQRAGSYLRVGDISGLAALWHEDARTAALRAIGKGKTLSADYTALGLYQEVASQWVPAGGSASLRRTVVGATVHKAVEVQPLTDDETEKALLAKKTFFLASSSPVVEDFFEDDLVSGERRAREVKDYDRYFDDKKGFAEPDEKIAPAPPLRSRQYFLQLCQAEGTVDSYPLLPNETAVDCDTLYLSGTFVAEGSTITTSLPSRRVFFAVSTSISDKVHAQIISAFS